MNLSGDLSFRHLRAVCLIVNVHEYELTNLYLVHEGAYLEGALFGGGIFRGRGDKFDITVCTIHATIEI